MPVPLQQRRKLISFQREYLRNQVNTNFHWAIKRADMSLTIYQNYANIREEAFFYAKKQIG